jgi:hypothetical protein
MLKQKYFLTDFFILSAEKQPIKLSWRNIEWSPEILRNSLIFSKFVLLEDKTNTYLWYLFRK